MTSVRPKTTRKVTRIEVAATSSGTTASTEPNTNASTPSAPSPPSSVSASTSGPPDWPPSSSSLMPVTRTVQPAGSAWASVRVIAGPRSGAPKIGCGGTNTSAKVVRPSAAAKRRSRLLA